MGPSMYGRMGPECQVQTARRGCSLAISLSSKDFMPDNRLQSAANKAREHVG